MEMQKLREELREMVEASSLLLDDRLYTFDSYRSLVQAVAYAKVALAKEAADEDMLRGAFSGLCEAVDAMEARADAESNPSAKFLCSKKANSDMLRRALPYLLGGAALGGFVLGGKVFSRKKKKEKECVSK